VLSSLKGVVIARHPLSDIANVKVVKGVDGWAIGFALAATALEVVAYQFVAWPGWRWVAFIVLVLVAGLFLASVHKYVLHLELASGAVQYDVRDSAEEAIGFAASLKGMLLERAGRAERVRLARDGDAEVASWWPLACHSTVFSCRAYSWYQSANGASVAG
jgi:MFS family permease